MLILKRVEIQGFKSFCDRTEMRFGGKGVAAIVGPNGCGKSNLADAINWVLGEQSAKSLRGSNMQDVIFAGTRERKPLGMAQVTMVLVDPEGQTHIPGSRPEPLKGDKGSAGAAREASRNLEAPEAQQAETIVLEGPLPVQANGHGHGTARPAPGREQEITITRRLFRSGESEYLINGRHARLRDIQELFMGTGLGPESYAIIEQGRIGQILSSKPLDRRSVIEEAAGISKFKSKRRLAEAKLESAKQNLSRVFDILEEVSRQVNSLKRQAAKAKRHEELKAELEVHLRAALSGRFQLLQNEAARIAGELRDSQKAVADLQEQVGVEDAALRQARETLYQTESDLTSVRQKLSEVRLEAERTRGQIESQVKQIAGIEQRLQQGETEGEHLGQRLAALDQEHTHLSAQFEEFQSSAAEARERLRSKNAEREQLETLVRERERTLESARQQVVRLLGEAASLRNQVGQIDAYIASMERDETRVRRDEEAAVAELSRLESLKREQTLKLSSRQMELETTQEQRQRVEEGLAESRAALKQTREEQERLRAELLRVKGRRDSLEEILSHRAYTTETVKRLFAAVETNQADGLKPAGVLADFVELTDPQFEKATEEFLHEELEYVVVKGWEEAQRGLDVMRSDFDGRATFLVEPCLNADPATVLVEVVAEPPIGPETGILGRLSDGLRFTNGLTNAPAALLPRLARCYLAENRESAQRLSLQYPDLYFLLSDGICYHGHAVTGGRRTGNGPLALKRELRELNAMTQKQQTQLAAAEERVRQLEAESQSLAEHLEVLRGQQQRQEKDALVLEQEMRKLSEDLNRANQKLSLSRLELERLTRDSARARQNRDEKQSLVETKEAERTTVESALQQDRGELDEMKSRLSLIAEEHSVLRVELAGLEERKRAIENAIQRLAQQSREVAHRRSGLGEEMDRLAVSRTRLLELNLQLDTRAGELAGEESHFVQQVARLAEEEATLRDRLSAFDQALKELRQSASEAQERRGHIELELVRRQAELKFLDETSRKELNLPVSELAASPVDAPAGEPPASLDELGVAEAEDRVQEVRKKIEALGGVNPEAWKEFQEAQQRYDFLNAQRQDLLDSIKDTDQAIKEIDTESRKRFSEAFEVINENFRVTFSTLFGGGTGEMRLTGEGDQLDQGIEIVAQPPGKRLQNVLLLSGGEKALTAMALLMGIFKYQPSPFCVLDEVDAPLDEANVGRFTQLVKEMAAQTQFIVITHAKRTMEAAEALYGVTMQEQGVSKLVSVRLQAPPPPVPVLEPQSAAVS